ncbi:MAG: AI-2E family transporter, partial [Atopobiaceae bacterium]|nr:AI-2E family transporter [Atopobiaceae bacterium]
MHRFFKTLTRQQIELGLYAVVLAVLAVGLCFALWATGPFWDGALGLLGSITKPLAYGFMLSYALNPIVERISHGLRGIKPLADKGEKRRAIAVAITALLIVVLLLGIIAAFGVMVASGISNFEWPSLKDIIAGATEDITGFIKSVQERLSSWGLISENTENTMLVAVGSVTDFASTALFSAMFTIYFLLDGDRLFGYFHRILFNLMGEQSGTASILLDDADRVISGYFRGQATDAALVAVLSGVLLTLVGVPHAPVVGLLTGLANLIPYLGGPVGYGSVIAACLSEQAWYQMALGVVVMSIVSFVDGNILNPRLLSNSVEVHPMLVAIALIAGGAVGGVAGMLVAVPTAAWLKIQLDRWMDANEVALAKK